ncbi:MAG TPA: dihydrofolate reductase family protein [Planctomycetota bacterium]|nr:dihydrofolate reductase family protein [Planctomycetota bacterium]
MPIVKVASFAVSIDGYAAGPRQSVDNPLGERGFELMGWVFPTRTFRSMHGDGGGGERGIDDDMAAAAMAGNGAWILGRNMFGPVRGPWPDESWKGWWGDTPPYHVPVFVLTHHVRQPLTMAGGTTFHFVTDGPESALRQAKAAAGAKDVRIGGGVATVRQYLQAGAIDEMHLAVSPVVLGEGEHLFAGLDLPKLGYSVAKTVQGENATHVVLRKG